MSTKYKADQLLDDIYTENTISCTKKGCKETDNTFNCDEYDTANYMFKKGWRRTENHCYCPQCAKKHLKQK